MGRATMTAFYIDPTSLTVLLILFSPAIGSFLALLADRLPRGEDVVFQRSTCRNCNTPIRNSDLIPLVSYLLLRGKCRGCSAPIPLWLPLMECAAAALAIASTLVAQSDLQMLLGCGFLWCLLVLFASDAQWFRLPDQLTSALLIFALALAWEDPYFNISDALLGSAAGSGSFLAIRLAYQKLRNREGLGLGDVKLMAGIGAAVGPTQLPLVVLIAALGALLWAIFDHFRYNKPLQSQAALPFGSFLCLSAAAVWLFI
jgi:leader peptidase (prepilin peptidase)/N-methyltransferase